MQVNHGCWSGHHSKDPSNSKTHANSRLVVPRGGGGPAWDQGKTWISITPISRGSASSLNFSNCVCKWIMVAGQVTIQKTPFDPLSHCLYKSWSWHGKENSTRSREPVSSCKWWLVEGHHQKLPFLKGQLALRWARHHSSRSKRQLPEGRCS